MNFLTCSLRFGNKILSQDLTTFCPTAPQKGSRLKVGVQKEVTTSRCVCVRKRSPSVRKRPQASASVAHMWQSRNGVLVPKHRTVVTFGLAPGPRVSKVSTATGIRGASSRNAQISLLLDLRLVFAFGKCQQSQGSGGGRETQNCRHSWN